MHYPVVIHKDTESDYGVTVPDLPGCFSAGETLDEALQEAMEAIECHLEGLLADGEPIPTPKPVELHQSNPDDAGGIGHSLLLMLQSYQVKRAGSILRCLSVYYISWNKYASERGESRSELITQAVLEYIGSRETLAR